MENKLNDTIKGNAISAYLMIFISWLFLFNKQNPNINNDFVKNHTKSAFLVHIWFLITYVILITNDLFATTTIFWMWLNDIIANIVFLLLLSVLVYWMYRARNGLEFELWKTINISKKHSVLDIDWDWQITEREKFTILLSYIPFIGFLNFAKYRSNDTINKSTRLNIVVSLIICLLYIFDYTNLVSLFSLAYTIFIAFIWVNLFTRDELVQINLSKYFSAFNFYVLLSTFVKYLINYIKGGDFPSFWDVLKSNFEALNKNNSKDEKDLVLKRDIKIPRFLIYIPFINLIFLFIRNTRYSFHIINGLIITLIFSVVLWLSFFTKIDYSILILLFFPICFWISYSRHILAYKTPFIFDIYVFISSLFSWFKFGSKKINQKRKEVNEINLKVK